MRDRPDPSAQRLGCNTDAPFARRPPLAPAALSDHSLGPRASHFCGAIASALLLRTAAQLSKGIAVGTNYLFVIPFPLFNANIVSLAQF
jgi:hypothetical protein